MNKIEFGDCREIMRRWAKEGVKVQTCVTSPPYYGLRNYGHDDQIGLEETPQQYIQAMVEVFRCVRDILDDTGVVWANFGDSYVGSGNSGGKGMQDTMYRGENLPTKKMAGLKPKNILGIPWRVAFALQDDGWILRQDIIWCLSGGVMLYARTQTGEMPMSVKDLTRLDPATVQLWNGKKWTQVLGYGESTDKSNKIDLLLRSGERIGCTGDHLWPVEGKGNVKAKDLKVGDILKSCTLPEPKKPVKAGYLTDDVLWFIGLYLAEGSRSCNTKIQISLNADEASWIKRLTQVAHYLGGTLASNIEGNCLYVRMYGKMINAVLDDYLGGYTAHDKRFATKVWQLPNDALKQILTGYFDGDGHYDKSNKRIRLGFCRNYYLEKDLRTAAARLGATITLTPTMATYQNGQSPSFRGEWRWDTSGHFNEKNRSEIVGIKKGTGRKFWDIAVKDKPHLFSLASGVLTHNCKPNPMPESVMDRCTKAHEYIFLLAKQPDYYFDRTAMLEPATQGVKTGQSTFNSITENGPMQTQTTAIKHGLGNSTLRNTADGTRNKRSVWTVNPKPYKGAHFAVYPEELIEPCILAGSRRGDIVLDPFMGSGTTAAVATKFGRQYLGCELNPEYEALQQQRIKAKKLSPTVKVAAHSAYPTTIKKLF